jgi:hypothetical protein
MSSEKSRSHNFTRPRRVLSSHGGVGFFTLKAQSSKFKTTSKLQAPTGVFLPNDFRFNRHPGAFPPEFFLNFEL